MNKLKRFIVIIYRCVFLPTTNGGWPLVAFEQHKIAARIWWEFLARSQKFGGFTLYQSFPPLNLPGLRDTERRLAHYRFDEFSENTSSVLDIGSNMGFISNILASRGQDVTGVEFNPRLHTIATGLAQFLGNKSVKFENASFPDWICERQFDVVLALAVHKWVGMPIDAFVKKVSDLTRSGGTVFFESNNYTRVASEFDKEVAVFESSGFKILHAKVFDDDCKRKIVVFRKAV